MSTSASISATTSRNTTTEDADKSAYQQAFDKAVDSIAVDMSLLMHGSGDVPPADVSPESAHLLSTLTVQYLAHLVEEALHAHEMLMDGDKYNKTFPPPPVFKKSRIPPVPLPPERLEKRKNISSQDEFWDEPLKPPKIIRKGESETEPAVNEKKPVLVDEWVGVSGVDLLETRTRKAFVRGTAGLTTQSFIFPICHDVYAYGRVTEVQTAERLMAPVLMDPVMKELVQTEGKIVTERPHKKKKKDPGNLSDPEDEDDDEVDDKSDQGEEDGPSWPDVDLLPVYRNKPR
jgi:hypothetical protein